MNNEDIENETDNKNRTSEKPSEPSSEPSSEQPLERPSTETKNMNTDPAFRAATHATDEPEVKHEHMTHIEHPKESTGRHATEDWKKKKE